ncbi:MAG: LapA family protein [Gammaproteobacteria bacterium]|nr:LapA family protein [Gammaproteobacteria bacterium]
MIRFISLLVSLPIIILISAFAFNNPQLVLIDLFTSTIELPLAVALLISLLIGVVIGFVFNLLSLYTQKKKYLRLKHKKETLNGLSEVLDKAKNDK